MGKSEAGRSQKEALANSRSQEHMTLSGGMGLGGGKHLERCEGTGRVGSYLNMRAPKVERGVRGCCHLRCACLGDRGTNNRNGKSRSRCRLVGEEEVIVGETCIRGLPLLRVQCWPWCECGSKANAAGPFPVFLHAIPSLTLWSQVLFAELQHLASVLPHAFFFQQSAANLGLWESKSYFSIS